MKSNIAITTLSLLTAGLAPAGPITATSPYTEARAAICPDENWNYPAEASTLLRQVQFSAARLALDAEMLSSQSRSGLSRQGHSNQVNRVREQINTIAERLARLQAIRHLSDPWQQLAIDAVAPPAAHVAVHTQAAILHLNDHGKPLWDFDYRDHLRAISDRSNQVMKAINLHLEMADTQDRLDRLRDRAGALGA